MRTSALALVAVGMGAIGGLLVARQPPRPTEPVGATAPANLGAVPVPVRAPVERERPALDPTVEKTPAPASEPPNAHRARRTKASMPASVPGETAVNGGSTAGGPTFEAKAPPAPQRPVAPAELWKADDAWLDQQR